MRPCLAAAFRSGRVSAFCSGKGRMAAGAPARSISVMKRLTIPRAGRPEKARVIGCAYRRLLHAWLATGNIVPEKVLELSSYHMIVACVASGTGRSCRARYWRLCTCVTASRCIRCRRSMVGYRHTSYGVKVRSRWRCGLCKCKFSRPTPCEHRQVSSRVAWPVSQMPRRGGLRYHRKQPCAGRCFCK
jgi:hypothetical protein